MAVPEVHLHLHGVTPEVLRNLLGSSLPGTTGWHITSDEPRRED